MKPLDHRALQPDLQSPERPGADGPAARAAEDFRTILDGIPQMVWAHLPGADRHEYYNARWIEFTGVDLAADGSTRRQLIHPDDREHAVGSWRRALQMGEPYEAEYRLRHRTGEYRWILSRGRPERDARGGIVRWYGSCVDIHEQVLAREALNASAALNRSIIQATADCIKMIDSDGKILFLNEAALRELGGADVSTALGRLWIDTLPVEARSLAITAMGNALAGRAARFTTFRRIGGEDYRWCDFAVTPILEVDGRASRLVVSSRDVTDEKIVQERLRWTANHDALTHLPNRAHFHDCLREAIGQADLCGRCVGLLIVDVDNLKEINDALGHDAGDGLLCAFAERLSGAVPECDVVGRLGGDEFGVILIGIGGKEEVAFAAEKIVERLREPFTHEGRLLDCRGSIGASLYPDQGKDKGELMKQADVALYVAKAAGRGQWLLFDPKMRAELQTRASMLSMTREALQDERIVPFYQPKIDLRTGAVAGFEALLRWRDRQGKIHLPGTIAAAFEDNDLAVAISARIIGCALADMRRWLDAGLPFHHVAINASAVDFSAGDFAERVLGMMRLAAIPAPFVQLEVTETVFLGRGAEYVETALKTLSAAGLKIALDDFGTGFASLSHLKRFPVDVLKIDRSFVRNLGTDAGDAAIIRGVINLSKSLEIETVAEGVETAEQQRFLADHGCDYGQGYLFAKAVAADQVPALLGRAPGRAGSCAPGRRAASFTA